MKDDILQAEKMFCYICLFVYSQAKCFLKAKCFGTRFPLNNSCTSEDILTPFGQLEALIDDTVDTQAQWSGYTSYRETGQ